jgi:hypothetical protein
MLVAEHRLERIEVAVGSQHEDAVELPLLFDLGEALAADRLVKRPSAPWFKKALALSDDDIP